MIEFDYLTVAAMRAQGEHLLKEHYDELTKDKDIVKLNVDWTSYNNLEQSGNLVAIGAWENKVLIGYAVFILNYNLHYQDTLMALNDVLFLTKSKRKGTLGIRLIKESERILKSKGVVKLLWHVKLDTTAATLFPKLGYKTEEITLGKILR